MIPSKDRHEWKDLVTGELDVTLKNFFFQMKVTQTRNLLKQDRLTIEEAIDDMYNLCVKFSKANNLDADIEAIFGQKLDKSDEQTIEKQPETAFEEKGVAAEVLSKEERVQKILEAEKAARARKEAEELAKARIEAEEENDLLQENERRINEAREALNKKIEEDKLLAAKKQERLNELITRQKEADRMKFAKKQTKKTTRRKKQAPPKKTGIGSFFRSIFGS